MPKTRQQKEDLVTKITDKLSRAKSVVFADYKGLTMAQLTDLRNKLREVGAEFTITKNSLLKLALGKSIPEGPARIATQSVAGGPIASLFSYKDEISPIKILVKVLKDLPARPAGGPASRQGTQIGSVKAGIFEGEFIDNVMINKLAELPSKDELRVKIVGSLGSPLYGIVGVLQANLRNLVYVLEQIRVQRSASA